MRWGPLAATVPLAVVCWVLAGALDRPAVQDPDGMRIAPAVYAVNDVVEATIPNPSGVSATLRQEGPSADLPLVVSATITADRGQMIQVTETLPPPVATGLNGLPFAPAGMSGCDEMEFYRAQWGLPQVFDGMGYRESNCRNDVENRCCHGYWQLHESYWSHVPKCEVYSIYDAQGTSGLSKQKNACLALHVYGISGCGAWSTCPW
jgi:hypothetical protein